MIDYGKRNVLGVEVDALDLDAALERILYFAEQRRPYRVSALAVHGVIEATREPVLQAALNDFDLVLPDGQAVRWALNLLYGLGLPDKVPGPTVVDHLLVQAAEQRLPVFFYGSTPETLSGIEDELTRRYGDSLEVHSTPSRFGAVDAAEVRRIAETINSSGAQVCFVGLGCPRQEKFVAAIGAHLCMPSLAVGAAFDYIAGSIARASPLVQRAGLEWAQRLVNDPRRLARRYLTTNSIFVAKVGRQLVAQKLPGRQSPGPSLVKVALGSIDGMPWDHIDG